LNDQFWMIRDLRPVAISRYIIYDGGSFIGGHSGNKETKICFFSCCHFPSRCHHPSPVEGDQKSRDQRIETESEGFLFVSYEEIGEKRDGGEESGGGIRLLVQGGIDRRFGRGEVQPALPIHPQRVLPRV